MASSKELAQEEAQRKTEALDWIQAVIEEKVPRDQPFEKVLKDGIILCKLANKIVPGSIKKVNKAGGNFALMENLAAYQKVIKAYGVPDEEIFQTVDLFEARNVKQVVKSIHALGRICQQKGFAGPTIGPKMAEAQHREWTEDELRANRQGIIGLQMGSNQGASQAGLNMGKARSIND